MTHTLESAVDALVSKGVPYADEDLTVFAGFKHALNTGQIRAAEPDSTTLTGWRVNAWVKRGILLGFRMGNIADQSSGALPFFDKDTYPLKHLDVNSGVRIVPGGSSIRDGAYVGRGVTCMPPMYINVGAYIDEGSMVDSHALIGSCAQIGRRVHVSAASQIGGVLEPVGAMPVIVEDDVLVGGNCGIYEGTVVKARAVLGTGTILNRSTPLFDLIHHTIHKAEGDQPLIVPPEAVVVPGSRAIRSGPGRDWGLSLQCAVIVKYRDRKTEGKIQLEDLLR